jgi:hypothetical protein
MARFEASGGPVRCAGKFHPWLLPAPGLVAGSGRLSDLGRGVRAVRRGGGRQAPGQGLDGGAAVVILGAWTGGKLFLKADMAELATSGGLPQHAAGVGMFQKSHQAPGELLPGGEPRPRDVQPGSCAKGQWEQPDPQHHNRDCHEPDDQLPPATTPAIRCLRPAGSGLPAGSASSALSPAAAAAGDRLSAPPRGLLPTFRAAAGPAGQPALPVAGPGAARQGAG